jgi:hypothetical protein
MKVFGIVGSPDKNGNVDLLVSQVLKGARVANGLKHLRFILTICMLNHAKVVALILIPSIVFLTMT